MSTIEEALEQGWLTPVPTFFGPLNERGTTDAFDWARECPFSMWSPVEYSDPKPVLNEDHPSVRALKEETDRLGTRMDLSKAPPELIGSLPHVTPIARPVRYKRRAVENGYR